VKVTREVTDDLTGPLSAARSEGVSGAEVTLAISCKGSPAGADEGCEQAWVLPEVEQVLIT
jgi:hypothetical protein